MIVMLQAEKARRFLINTTLYLLCGVLVAATLAGCSSNAKNLEKAPVQSTDSSSGSSKDSNFTSYMLPWLGKDFSKVQEDAKYNNETLAQVGAGYKSTSMGYRIPKSDQVYSEISSSESDKLVAFKNGVVDMYGELLKNVNTNVYQITAGTPFQDIPPDISSGDSSNYDKYLTWQASNGYFSLDAIVINDDYKAWNVRGYCYHTSPATSDTSEESSESSSDDDSSDDISSKTQSANSAEDSISSADGDTSEGTPTHSLTDSEVSGLNCKVSIEQGKKIVESNVTIPNGFWVEYGNTQKISGNYYYIYLLDGEAGVDEGNAYCVDVYSGKLYRCSENMTLTAVK